MSRAKNEMAEPPASNTMRSFLGISGTRGQDKISAKSYANRFVHIFVVCLVS
ncbi:hypothetical protein FHX15_005533 [Rhizobium sp. BK650]|nr:hypothetical protein [Rhizobium sp. BK650]